ncbi:YNFM family putative membrane transporter [Alkalihalobacillus xiaoxiensis]|uniref:YNFM family putative membrane transporter n=1 Tax=Shouchella xiaoxiensis TaxID=766895 RepID=A0ABS2SZ56_9BACI|nr:MFS transporter [Shouchella xiaoxiensis]MBM7840802.1 YNFM family putative membrane transporter [Shouchella xiaoxiensis]
MDYIREGTSSFKKVNLALFIAGVNTFAILYCVQPLLEPFTREFAVSPSVSSLALSVTTIFLAVSMLVMGSLSEVWGRKGVMVVAMFASSFLCLASAFAPDFYTLLLLRLVIGITLAGVPSIAMAYLGEEMAKSSLAKAIGIYISGNAFGAMAGRFLAGSLADLFNWQTALFAIGMISLAAAIAFYYLLRPSQHFQAKNLHFGELSRALGVHLKSKPLLSLFGLGFLLLGSNVALYNFIGFELINRYQVEAVYVNGVYLLFIIGMFSSVLIGRLVARIGQVYSLYTVFLLISCGTIVSLMDGVGFKIIGLALTTFSFFGGHSIASSLVSRMAMANKAQASSLYLLMYYAGSSVGGTLAGVFWGQIGWAGVVIVVNGFMVIGIGLIRWFSKTTRLEIEQDKASSV